MHACILSLFFPDRLYRFLHGHQSAICTFVGILRMRRRMVSPDNDLSDARLNPITAYNGIRLGRGAVEKLHHQPPVAALCNRIESLAKPRSALWN